MIYRLDKSGPARYERRGHVNRTGARLSNKSTTPYGYCECGCGQQTPLAPKTYTRTGQVKGQPTRFMRYHYAVKPLHELYEVEDRGYKTPCWIWQRSLRNGYGQLARCQNGERYAHRFYYIELRGPIPAGLDLDHLCRIRACVNPDHLEPVTRAENLRRGRISRGMTR
jgi:hypothetical protein